jgi:DNA-binding IclR family transcriptional regulator
MRAEASGDAMSVSPQRAADTDAADGPADAGQSRSVASRVAAILLAVAEVRDSSLTEAAQRTGLPLSTAHRLLRGLVRGRLLERMPDGRYRVRSPLQGPADVWQRAWDARILVCQVLDDLGVTTGCLARFGVWRGPKISYLERPPGTSDRTCATGLVPLAPHATALGKVLLAYAPPALVKEILDRGLPAHTKLTITTLQELEWSLTVARRDGLAVAWGERTPGLGAVAVPVRVPDGSVVGALELSAGSLAPDMQSVRASLLVAARGLGRALAARPAVLPTGTGATPLDWRADPTNPSLSSREPDVAG